MHQFVQLEVREVELQSSGLDLREVEDVADQLQEQGVVGGIIAVLSGEAQKVLAHIRLGGALPHLHLPLPGTEPNAFIIVCSTAAEDRYVDIDLGISAQSMLLQAAEIGLNGICIGAFDKERIRQEFGLEGEPLLILAVGKSAERIERVEIGAGGDRRYYRSEGVHYVPKIRAEELIIDSDSAETGDKS